MQLVWDYLPLFGPFTFGVMVGTIITSQLDYNHYVRRSTKPESE